MTLLAPLLPAPRPRAGGGAADPIRTAVALLCSRSPLDHVRAPDGLQYPVSERSRRLMRNARVCGG